MNILKKILSIIIITAVMFFSLFASEASCNLPQNINQIGKGLTNNIISQSVKNALTDDNKNIIETVNQYIADDKKIALIQTSL